MNLTELEIDSILDDGLLKDVPIVGLLVVVKNTTQNIHDRNLLRQTLKFIQKFNSGTISEGNLATNIVWILRYVGIVKEKKSIKYTEVFSKCK